MRWRLERLGSILALPCSLTFGNELTDVRFRRHRQAVLEDMEKVRALPYLRKDLTVLGFVLDIVHGTAEQIEA